MNLSSNRLLLKELSRDDLILIHKLHSIPAVDEFNTLGIPKSINETNDLLNPILNNSKSEVRKHYWFSIFLMMDSRFTGLCGINVSADRFKIGEIFYKLMPDYWGHGYATEAAKALVLFGFNQLHLHRIEAGVATGNAGSIRVLEKTGMKREGKKRKILPIRGEWKDNYLYAILEDDKRDY